MKIYTKMHLLAALKDAGLPSTYKSLLKMEREGVVPGSAGNDNSIPGRSQRFYTETEIVEIVDRVKLHKQK